ncbi:hypothetical protein GCM10010401_15950 [Rarobacter faecitabidus]|uniref:Uncharacterized protein n=1 Tax=Rarobacter faecitabidus TaxID=13243 RepID=A0A542ZXB9_RARFA|nr:DUF6350 family protein [Rarobacter faecitabidus]TQL65003.1 hypothetical protein FB461_1536 [Rarobacter faecitabidus]
MRPPIPAWISGAIAALQAFAWSWGLLVVPAVAAFVSAAAQVTTQDSWRSAVGVASRLWLLGHGGTVTVDGATISLIPLGIALLAFAAAYLSARRASRHTLTALISFTITYSLIAQLIALIMGSFGPRLLILTVIIALTGGYLGFRRQSAGDALVVAAPHWLARWNLPALRAGVAGGGASLALLLGIAAVLVTLWAFAGRAAASDIIASLDPDSIGGIVLGGAQLTYLFTLLIWAVAWLTGVGFHVGLGSEFAPAHVALDPLPAVPLLAALPTGDMAGGYTSWLISLVFAAGIVGGLVVWRRLRRLHETAAVPWRDCAIALGASLAFVFVVLVVAFWLATGSIGPGRLASAGPDVLGAALSGSLLIAAGATVTVTFLHPWLRAQVRAAWWSVFGRSGNSENAGERR